MYDLWVVLLMMLTYKMMDRKVCGGLIHNKHHDEFSSKPVDWMTTAESYTHKCHPLPMLTEHEQPCLKWWLQAINVLQSISFRAEVCVFYAEMRAIGAEHKLVADTPGKWIIRAQIWEVSTGLCMEVVVVSPWLNTATKVHQCGVPHQQMF